MTRMIGETDCWLRRCSSGALGVTAVLHLGVGRELDSDRGEVEHPWLPREVGHPWLPRSVPLMLLTHFSLIADSTGARPGR